METLPEKWWIKPRNYDEQLEIWNWLPKNVQPNYSVKDIEQGWHFPDFNGGKGFVVGGHTGQMRKEYTEITFEDFEKFVLNKKEEAIIYNNYSLF